jgi:pSer/pThr/pTyr-binding forkhead associated (FHA) protein
MGLDGVANQLGFSPQAPSPSPQQAPLSGGEASIAAKMDFNAFPTEGASTSLIDISLMAEPLTATLLVEAGDTNQREYKLGHDRTTMGRGEDCQAVLPGKDLSRMHMVFERKPQGFSVRDLQSSNGTFLNGHRILYGELRDGDLVEAGRFRLRFKQRGGDPSMLWKGAPRVDFHPNDHPNARAYMASLSASAAATPGDLNQTQSTISVMPAFTPGAKLPDYSNPSMTNPKMVATEASMAAFQVPKKGPQPVKILIIGAVLIFCVAAAVIVWLLATLEPTSEAEAAASNTAAAAQNQAAAQEKFDQAQKFYQEGKWDEALSALEEAKKDPAKKPSAAQLQANVLNDRSAAQTINALLTAIDSPDANPDTPEALAAAQQGLRDLLSIDPQGTYLSDHIRNQYLPKLTARLTAITLGQVRVALTAKDATQALALTKTLREQIAQIPSTRADLKAFALDEASQTALAEAEKAAQDLAAALPSPTPPAPTPAPTPP